MKISERFILFGLIVLAFQTAVYAQERCSITRYQKLLDEKNTNREQPAAFEQWMTSRLRQGMPNHALSAITIPVVVHIIHNGESVGSLTNLSEAQILSQIDVLNKDFQRTNADAIQTPAEFSGVAGQLPVQFVLAKRDPNGLPSNGIVRVNGGKASWSLSEESSFKALSYWPAEDYLNIWVLNLSGSDIGYASFPVSTLAGLESASNDRLIDGVIADYFVFGSKDYGTFSLDTRYDKGRTVTHEVGHFLGLRHIWGDGSNCQATDYVDDTPPQSAQTTGCPTHPQISCAVPKMFQNYMDYTNDVCMNIFTSGQIGRMQVVLANSPRRKSLTTSLGGVSPNYTLDAALQIISPQASACPGTLIPQISVQGIGSSTVNSVKIAIRLNGNVLETKNFPISLSQGAVSTVSFSAISTAPGTQYTFSAELLEVNGASDEILVNNNQSVTFNIPVTTNLPFLEEFAQLPSGWSVVNPDGLYGWETSPVRGGSLIIESYNYDNTGAKDAILTPVFSASAVSNMLLQFDLAYARYPDNDEESLTVYLLEDCSEGLSGGQVIYKKQGSALATVSDRLDPFIPDDQDWRRETVPLNAFAGKSNLRLAFVYQNGYGNNFYLDRIRLATGEITNMQLVRLTEPGPAVCNAAGSPKIMIRNLGSVSQQSINVQISVNGSAKPVQNISTPINPGEDAILSLGEINWIAGTNTVSMSVLPGAGQDEDVTDNSLETIITYIIAEDKPPLRSTFDDGVPWIALPATDGLVWNTTNTNKGLSAVFAASGQTADGREGWLVTPSMDFSATTEASLFADISYSLETGTPETLRLVASLDCGSTFTEEIFAGDVSVINNNQSDTPWTPDNDDEWSRQYFDISALAGRQNVLLGLVATNRGGNNLYADNIEFYLSNDPQPLEIEELFRVYRDEISGAERITFNLTERSAVRLQMLASTGVPVLDNTYSDILNQTLEFELGLPPGIYIYRFFIGQKTYAVRHFVP